MLGIVFQLGDGRAFALIPRVCFAAFILCLAFDRTRPALSIVLPLPGISSSICASLHRSGSRKRRAGDSASHLVARGPEGWPGPGQHGAGLSCPQLPVPATGSARGTLVQGRWGGRFPSVAVAMVFEEVSAMCIAIRHPHSGLSLSRSPAWM